MQCVVPARVCVEIAGHRICEVELAAVGIALSTWRQFLTGALLLVFIDNNSALAAMVRGTSEVVGMRRRASEVWRVVAAEQLFPWFERVATDDNVIDGISRGERPQSLPEAPELIWDDAVFPEGWPRLVRSGRRRR